MRRVLLAIFFISVCAHDEERADALAERALTMPLPRPPLHQAGLESTALGKPSHARCCPRPRFRAAGSHFSSSPRANSVPLFPLRPAVPVHHSVRVLSTGSAVSEEGISTLKSKLLRMAASLDRGQAYNPTSGALYADRTEVARDLINAIVGQSQTFPTNLSAIDGEWELVFSTVKHGIFRSSPFFLAIQEALGGPEQADLAFKLHELQTHQWGLSKVGRVAQYINSTEKRLYSEFDTSLLSMTAIPLIGFDKLFPTFGGCVVTVSDVELVGDRLQMEVQYTEGRPVPGLPSLPGLPPGVASPFQNQRVPVNEIWQRLPWNNGKRPTCSVQLRYVDEDMRIVADGDGDFFVYSRPVDPRSVCSVPSS